MILSLVGRPCAKDHQVDERGVEHTSQRFVKNLRKTRPSVRDDEGIEAVPTG